MTHFRLNKLFILFMLVADWFKVVGDRKRLLYVFLKNYVFFKEKDRGRNFKAPVMR